MPLPFGYPRTTLVSLASFVSILTGRAVAEVPHAVQYDYEHSNSLEDATQKFDNASRRDSLFLIDQGMITAKQSQYDKSYLGTAEYTLGVDQDGHSFERLRLGQNWNGSSGVHQYRLGIAGNFENYHGALGFLDLERQNILADQGGGGGPQNLSDSMTYDGSLGLSDKIRLAQYTDLFIDGSHSEGQSKVSGQNGQDTAFRDRRTFSSGSGRLEQRFGEASIWARVTDSDITTKTISGPFGPGPAKVKQSTLDSEARFNFPIYPRLTGNFGVRELDTKATQVPHIYRSGPETGLRYDGQTWQWYLEAFRAAAAGKDTELFGAAGITWLIDAQDAFNATISKDVDLQAAYSIAIVQPDPSAASRQDTTTVAQLNFSRLIGRSQFKLAGQRSLLDEETSYTHFSEASLDYSYALTPLDSMGFILVSRDTRYRRTQDPDGIDRKFESANIRFRHILPGILTAVGGQLFWSVATGVEHFTETPTRLRGDRVTFTFSLGQTGNF